MDIGITGELARQLGVNETRRAEASITKKPGRKNQENSGKQLPTKAQTLCREITRCVISSLPKELKHICCDRIAINFGISPAYLSRTFKATKGMSLREFIKRIKLLRCALAMYGNPDLTVEQIAGNHGFADIEYFRKSFKTLFGTTPQKFLLCK